MTTATKPAKRPANVHFSSGPCAKRPGWSPKNLENAFLGRSHRAKEGKARLKLAIDKTKALLGLPPGYLCAIVPASDTGAFEMAMWTMLGAARRRCAGLGELRRGLGDGRHQAAEAQGPARHQGRVRQAARSRRRSISTRDVLFTWNGTTSGVRVPNGDWIAADREGLTFVDATSAVFAQPIDWDKVDVAHLLLAEGAGRRSRARHADPVAARRRAPRELHAGLAGAQDLPPHQGRQAHAGVFEGETINTPSMLCVEDYLDALAWAESIGGLQGAARARRRQRQGALRLGRATPWLENLAVDPATRSNTSVCLKIVDPAVAQAARATAQRAFVKQLESILDKENAARDIAGHRDAPPHLRIWCGCDRRDGRPRGADALARLGLRRSQGRPRQGGVAARNLPLPACGGEGRGEGQPQTPRRSKLLPLTLTLSPRKSGEREFTPHIGALP